MHYLAIYKVMLIYLNILIYIVMLFFQRFWAYWA